MDSNIIFLIALVAVIVMCILLLKTKYKKQASEVLLYLVTQAEQQFGGGTGELKFSAVASWLYNQLPSMAKVILSEKTISNLIEDAVTYMKKYLEENKSAAELIGGGKND